MAPREPVAGTVDRIWLCCSSRCRRRYGQRGGGGAVTAPNAGADAPAGWTTDVRMPGRTSGSAGWTLTVKTVKTTG